MLNVVLMLFLFAVTPLKGNQILLSNRRHGSAIE